LVDLLGPFEEAVLLAIVQLGEDAYGRAILKHVQAWLGREVAAVAAHATLGRLEKESLVTSRLGSGTPILGRRALQPPSSRERPWTGSSLRPISTCDRS
jgi:PadR family transcriptional regulator, regulatory protein PadR